MSLPKIAVKNFTITLPISKKRVTYRPFLVKEQKILLSAIEESKLMNRNEGESHLLSNFKNVISNCIVSSKFNLDDLSLVDFNYLFLQVRIASSGESIDLLYTCSCGTPKEVKVNLDDIKVKTKGDLEKKIEIGSDIGVIMGLPKLRVSSYMFEGTTDVDKILKVVASSIKQIYDSQDVYDADSHTVDEIMEFVENMPTESLEQIKEFFEDLPHIEYKKDIDCPNGNEELYVREIEDFFQ
tara:strand:- start:205 stop:924 length:720 start_codon:yes stop_codon:yes gene_type:complete